MLGVSLSLLGKLIYFTEEWYSEYRCQKQYKRLVLSVQKLEARLTVVEQGRQHLELSEKVSWTYVSPDKAHLRRYTPSISENCESDSKRLRLL